MASGTIKSGLQLIATSSSSGTNASKLSTINSSFTNLSEAQRYNSVLEIGGEVFHYVGNGGYERATITSTTVGYLVGINVSSQTYVVVTLRSTGLTFSDQASTTTSTQIKLYA